MAINRKIILLTNWKKSEKMQLKKRIKNCENSAKIDRNGKTFYKRSKMTKK